MMLGENLSRLLFIRYVSRQGSESRVARAAPVAARLRLCDINKTRHARRLSAARRLTSTKQQKAIARLSALPVPRTAPGNRSLPPRR